MALKNFFPLFSFKIIHYPIRNPQMTDQPEVVIFSWQWIISLFNGSSSILSFDIFTESSTIFTLFFILIFYLFIIIFSLIRLKYFWLSKVSFKQTEAFTSWSLCTLLLLPNFSPLVIPNCTLSHLLATTPLRLKYFSTDYDILNLTELIWLKVVK